MAGDADFDKVSLLLHFDGADASSTFVDSSGAPKTVTAFGSAALSTSRSKFGGASLALGSAGSYARLTGAGDFAGADFTIEAWVYPTTTSGVSAIIGYSNGSAANSNYGFQLLRNGDAYQFDVFVGATQYGGSLGAGTVVTNTQQKIKFCRVGDYIYALIDEVLKKTTYIGSGALNSPPGAYLYIGEVSGYYPWQGNIDELRLTHGLGRDSSGGALETAAFPDAGTLYTLSGTVRDATNALAARKVAAYREDTNALVGTTTSDATTGVYSIETPADTAHTLVFYPALGESLNALVRRGVLPIET